MQASPKLKELAIKLEEGLPRAFVRVHTSRLARVRAAMLTTHPVYELCMCDLHITAAKRAKIVGDEILGSLAFVALFFSVDGSAVGARSPEECPIEQGSFLWYTFVALFSVLLNCVPRSLEYRLAQRGFVQKSHEHYTQQLLGRQLKDIGFWLVGSCLSLCYLLVVTAFLANLSEGDEAKWMFSFAVVVVRKLVVVPVLATLLSSVGTELSICALSGEALSPPKKFGLDLQLATEGKEAGSSTAAESEGAASEVWHQKVRDLAGRGISVRQLLDFYADLGQ
ncbi:SYT4, partial [Symbiodinium necroappetens]